MNALASSEHLVAALARAQSHWQTRDQSQTGSLTGLTIAISREEGANGPAVAAAVGKRLGWPVYDQELLRLIANEMGLRTSLLRNIDERGVSWVLGWLETWASAHAVTDGAYLYNLTKVVLSLAAHGGCVIVGRGAAQFLPPQKVLRVRLVAPLDERIAAAERQTGLKHNEAAWRLEQTDRDREAFVRDHFHKDPNDPANFDLVLNTSRFGVEKCAELIENALRRLIA